MFLHSCVPRYGDSKRAPIQLSKSVTFRDTINIPYNCYVSTEKEGVFVQFAEVKPSALFIPKHMAD